MKALLATKDINVNCDALHSASATGHTKVVKALLAAKDINVNKVDGGETALDIATEHNQTEIIQLLKDAGAQYSLHMV